MFSVLQRQLAQGVVGVGGGGDNDDIDAGILDHVFGSTVRLDAGVVLLGIVFGLRGALDNGVELQLRDFREEGQVEGFGTEAVANHANIPGLRGHIARE